MLIGELSRRTGFSHDTIRFYEKKGLIEVDKKQRRENNYKEYSDSVVDRLILIRTIKDLGFTLKEVDQFISAWSEEDASCEKLSVHLNEKIRMIDSKIEILNSFKARLNTSLSKCLNNTCEFETLLHGGQPNSQ